MTDKKKEFEALFTSHYARVYHYALSYINDAEICKDIVGDVFESVWHDYDLLKKETLSSYLYACTRNRCIDHLRHQSVREQYAAFLIENARYEQIPSASEHDARLEYIRKLIDRMPPQRQRVLRECFFQKKTYKEVAEEMGITVDGVKRHITIALKSLREEFSIVRST